MVKTAYRMRHNPEWLTAAPLWTDALADEGGNRYRQPALLRFDSDLFMDQLIDLLATEPARLKELVARPETWEEERVGWVPLNQAQQEAAKRPLKLFQPAHNRFYLVAASLVCHRPGLPDRALDPACKEKASFVLRRVVGGAEYGWVPGRERKGWFKVEPANTVLPDEERLPLFALHMREGDRNRRVLAGFIPVTSHDSYVAAPDLTPLVMPGTKGDGEKETDMRVARFETLVEGHLKLLAETLKQVPAPVTDRVPELQQREVSTFALLDLAELLDESFKDIWAWVKANTDPAAIADPHKKALLTALNGYLIGTSGETWDAALRATWLQREDIEEGKESTFVRNLKDASVATIKAALANPDLLKQYKLPDTIPDPPTMPKVDPALSDSFVIRCVYDRPCCKELRPSLVSEPTVPFRLAGFFDPDAPVRPVKIVMPEDTSIAGLRKYKKGVSIILSKKLRSQIERFNGLKIKQVEDGEIPGPPSFDLGRICSFSIPIITIVALILLMIIVYLLNIVFWWIPLLKICFPIKRR